MRQTRFPKLHSDRRRRSISLVTALLMAVVPAAAEPPSDLLEEVRTMLEAGMSEPIIFKWLDGSDLRPRRPSAADLVGLKKAGASDELLEGLLELADEAPESEPAAVAEPVAAIPPAATAPADATPAATPPADATPPAGVADEVPVYFELSYLPDFDEDEDEWQLYVYLDGEPLSFVPAGSFLSAKPLRFRQFLAPGKHMLRVAQERHVKRGRDRWLHSARMSELELPLELEPSARADVEIHFRQPNFAFGRSEGPLSFRLVQAKNVEVIEKQGGDPEDWPLVCEEIEANAEQGKLRRPSPRRGANVALDGCRRWSELWADLEIPSRDEVREALALFRYRPTPKDQPLD